MSVRYHAETTDEQHIPLRRNRAFNLLWIGQVASSTGAQVSGIALPLLVLATTGSPAKAGIVSFARTIPILLFVLPIGALADRVNRKRLMLAADIIRGLLVLSVAVALATRSLTFAQLVGVAFASGVAWIAFWVCENSALRHVVPEAQLSEAVARNQARTYGTQVAGPPLGGWLYGVAHSLPFLFDAISYAVSLISLALIRGGFSQERQEARRSLRVEIVEGLSWLWHDGFLRTTSLLVTGSDFVLNALFLVILVDARRQGAAPSAIGLMFGIVGACGVLGAIAAPRLAQHLTLRTVVIGVEALTAALVPALVLAHDAYLLGLIFGGTLALWPLWNAAVVAYRLQVTPEALQARLTSAALLFSSGIVPLGTLSAGFLLNHLSAADTILVFTPVTAAVAVWAMCSRSVRRAPTSLAAAEPLSARS